MSDHRHASGHHLLSIVDNLLLYTRIEAGRFSPTRELGNPFVRSEENVARGFQGTGLGLAICFGLVQAMAGRLDSESGHGTRVRLTLPACAAASQSAAAPRHAASA